MSNRKRQVLLLVVLICAAAWGVYMKPWEHNQPDSTFIEQAHSAHPSDTRSVDTMAAEIKTVPIVSVQLDDDWPKDPFLLSDNDTEAPQVQRTNSKLSLQGIMRIRSKQVCVLNGKTYEEGQTVEGWRVTRIDETKVTLMRGGERLQLTL